MMIEAPSKYERQIASPRLLTNSRPSQAINTSAETQQDPQLRARAQYPPITRTVEAASARYAARDRFQYPTEPAATPLQRYIQNACDPQNFEPNLALCLEIADLINAKKGNAPREAAVAVVGFVNHRNPNVSLLALSLLDICVKNCGYPFHLQISTKEFLNELVRRFPERPPIRATRVQTRILELIEEWRQTICQTSKYREDLGFIRDMHRLLSYKGYVFPEVRREDAAVLNPSDNLRSADEMEQEERAAQSAKLQELIRRGTPHDLQEANKLMKVMAGYDTRHKTDYRAKAAEEVGRIQQKAKLLEERLQAYQPGDMMEEGDVFEELANALASAQPKIQKMCEEESDDTEAVAKLFEINDSIHRTIQRYKLIKQGDLDGANAIPKGTLGTSGAGVKKGPNDELSLIDFGGPEDATASAEPAASNASTTAAPPAPAPKGNALEDDLLGLSMGDGNYGSGGGISLGPSNDLTSIMSPQQSTPKPATPSIFQQQFQQAPPQPQAQAQPKANYDPFASITGSSNPPSKPATPVPSIFAQQTAPHHQPTKSDPFAALAGTSRSASPFQFQQSAKAPTPAPPPAQATPAADLLGMGPANGTAPAAAPPAQDESEWAFSSALPEQPQDITVTNSAIKTLFSVSRPGDAEVTISSRISNNTAQPISDLTFQLAVTKGYTLKLEPQSGRTLSPRQQNGITQKISLHGVERGKGMSVKMRWRAGYSIGGEARAEQGEIAGLGVA